MAAIQPSQSLKDRKQALLLESELNRLVLQLELENLRDVAVRADTMLSRVGNYASWIMPALSVLGIFGGHKPGKPAASSSLFKLALGALPLALRFLRPKKSSN
jgi:hypothetical protein